MLISSILLQIAEFLGVVLFVVILALVLHAIGYTCDHFHCRPKVCDGCHTRGHHWITSCSYRPYVSFEEHLAGKSYIPCIKKYCRICAKRLTEKYSNTDMHDYHYYWDQCKTHRFDQGLKL